MSHYLNTRHEWQLCHVVHQQQVARTHHCGVVPLAGEIHVEPHGAQLIQIYGRNGQVGSIDLDTLTLTALQCALGKEALGMAE